MHILGYNNIAINYILHVENDLVWAEANNGGISKDGYEDLWLQQEIGAWDFKLCSQSDQTPTQGMEDLVKYHLSCTVILRTERETFDPVKSI